MTVPGTCGVVVTFHPGRQVFENLAKLTAQADRVVVVDNGSSAQPLTALRGAAQALGITLIENSANVGIAAALNTGIRWAKAHGFLYVALFDQDSTIAEEFMRAMVACYDEHPQPEKVAIVTPSQVERTSGSARVQRRARDGSPLVAITSGSLMPLTIFERCGYFQEDLIIDCVDHEYCLRARSLGYTLAECRQAVLLVAVGSLASHRALGVTIRARHYSGPRRYYMTRNRLVMIYRFWKEQPAWCCRTFRDIVQDSIKVALVEEERWSKMRHTGRGLYDALCGRLGKVVEL